MQSDPHWTPGLPERNDIHEGAAAPAGPAGGPPPGATGSPEQPLPSTPREIEHHPDESTIREDIVGLLRTIFDPEIPVNIYDIGLIYSIDVDKDARAYIRMTLTSPMCPVAGSLPGEVEMKVAGAPGVASAHVELVWDPPWGIDRMSEAARLQLNL